MTSPGYESSIARGTALSRRAGLADWPEVIPSLGPRCGGQPFARCDLCPPERHVSLAGSFVAYGRRRLCWDHARELARRELGG